MESAVKTRGNLKIELYVYTFMILIHNFGPERRSGPHTAVTLRLRLTAPHVHDGPSATLM